MSIFDLLPSVRKPSRYLGSERNAVRKSWDAAQVRLVLAFPDLYEIGMSHLGLQILYHVVNQQQGFLADRVYTPEEDLEALLRARREVLCSLEAQRPLKEFDIIGFSLPHELCYTNILTILDLAGIPWRAKARGEADPLIIGGGAGAGNPEPVADFFDAILLGDGEEAILDLMGAVATAKQEGWQRRQLLAHLAAIPGFYVPAFFEVTYQESGRIQAIEPKKDNYTKVRRRIVADIEDAAVAHPALVPFTKIVHDRLGIEIARGCTRGCRFCQAGMMYRPVRERSLKRILEIALEGLKATGFEELALLSLSSGDYSCLPQLLPLLMDSVADDHVSVSLPSMRVGTLTPELMEQIRRVRKTGFTLAPEAGSERLRLVLNKGITEADLLTTCQTAFALGWRLIKLYFMFGLPTETWEDIKAIPELVKRIFQASGGRRAGCQITVSVACFVPKPHTPFQWEPQLPVDQALERLTFLKGALRGKGFQLKWHDPRQSLVEGALARGDRRLAQVIEKAWQMGCRLDAWTDRFDPQRWTDAAAACGIELSQYLRPREANEILPWQHLDIGVSDDFLRMELQKAAKGEYTPDCRVHGCQQCGLCDFKKIRPVIQPDDLSGGVEGLRRKAAEGQLSTTVSADQGPTSQIVFYRLAYSILGPARFLGHLELIQVFFRVFRRVRLPLRFSQGFNPTPKVSFSPALPLGTESVVEYMDVQLFKALDDAAALIAQLNRELPEGLEVTGIFPDRALPRAANPGVLYRITLDRVVHDQDLRGFLDQETFIMHLTRKEKTRTLDARPLVADLRLCGANKVELLLKNQEGGVGVKPMELLGAFLGLSETEARHARILKVC